MRRWRVCLAFASLSCTAANPSYVGNPPPPRSDLGVLLVPDLSVGDDLAVSGVGPDMTAAACSAGARACVTTPGVASERCENGAFAVDRRCPFGTTTDSGAACASGYCAPPTTGTVTSCVSNGGPRETACVGTGTGRTRSCEPFINPANTKDVTWSCAYPAVAGTGVAGTTCTKGSDCRSGFCASNGVCFWACQQPQDCITPNLTCGNVTIDVEGVTVSAKSCS
jgi:hypothetical protein